MDSTSVTRDHELSSCTRTFIYSSVQKYIGHSKFVLLQVGSLTSCFMSLLWLFQFCTCLWLFVLSFVSLMAISGLVVIFELAKTNVMRYHVCKSWAMVIFEILGCYSSRLSYFILLLLFLVRFPHLGYFGICFLIQHSTCDWKFLNLPCADCKTTSWKR